MKNALILTLVLLAGCASTREIDKMESYLSEKELENPNHETVDKIKKHYFTKKAYQAIKMIPAIDGPAFGGYSAGTNFWTNVASFLTCNGVGRKIITPKSTLSQWGTLALVHEYIHHLDDIDRDEEAEFIDHKEFELAFEMLRNDMHWRGLYLWSYQQDDMMASDVFGGGKMSEQIAYVAQHLVSKGGPDYIKYVFRKMLRLKFKRHTTYTSIGGKVFPLILGREDAKD